MQGKGSILMDSMRELVPFIQWSFGLDRDERRAEATIGWDSLKLYLKEKEVEARGNGDSEPAMEDTKNKGKRKTKGVRRVKKKKREIVCSGAVTGGEGRNNVGEGLSGQASCMP